VAQPSPPSQWPTPHGSRERRGNLEEDACAQQQSLSTKKEWRKRKNKKKKPFFLEEDFRFLRSDSKEIFAGNKIREWGT